jgi:tetratricopeptide (TPR) repeat protein
MRDVMSAIQHRTAYGSFIGIASTGGRKAASSGHADAAPRAAVGLGMLLADQGDVQGAKDAFQEALDSGHADAAPRAAVGLGVLLENQGDLQGAKDAYQKAVGSGHAHMAPQAKPHARKSGSSSRAASLAVSASVSTPAEIRGSDIAATLSRQNSESAVPGCMMSSSASAPMSSSPSW